MRTSLRICYLVLLQFLAVCAYGESEDEYRRAILFGAEAEVAYLVVDDAGSVIPGARARIWAQTFGYKTKSHGWESFTDKDGMIKVKCLVNDRLCLTIEKDGYYVSTDLMRFSGLDRPKVERGRWLIPDRVRTIVLRRMKNPHVMVGPLRTKDFPVPAYGEWVGFDFMNDSFLPPYGVGKEADVLLRFSLDSKSLDDYHMTMEVSFTNHPFAGAYVMQKNNSSEMKSAYEADPNSAYLPRFAYRYDRLTNGHETIQMLKEKEYLVFRTRTRIDRDGKLIAAHYGKIYGPWHFVGQKGMNINRYFLNATPNDLNLEDKSTADYSKMLRRDQIYREEYQKWIKRGGR